MTSYTTRDRHEFVCDTCNKSHITITEDFRDAWDDLKDRGWTTFKHKGTWHHECANCSD